MYTGGDADWIELYNPNDNDVSTKGLYLTDKDDMLNRYKIPTVNVKPHSTLTIVCKNNKSENTLMKMQTNFSLKTGETLILSNESGEILGKVAIIDCSKDESLVRQRDGSYAKVRRPLKRTANNIKAVHQVDARLIFTFCNSLAKYSLRL